jgi:hypothetical protein
MNKKTKPPKATVEINHCTFNGSDSAGVIALARALEATARAIEQLAGHVSTPQNALLVLNDLGNYEQTKIDTDIAKTQP